jgi:hypothetical protein
MLATFDEGPKAGLGFPYEHPMSPSSKLWNLHGPKNTFNNCCLLAEIPISLDQGMHIVLYFRGGDQALLPPD